MADMNDATPLGAWVRSAISLDCKDGRCDRVNVARAANSALQCQAARAAVRAAASRRIARHKDAVNGRRSSAARAVSTWPENHRPPHGHGWHVNRRLDFGCAPCVLYG